MDYALLIIQLISGALGGNIAGALLKNQNLGTFGNAIAGIVGGGMGGQLLELAFRTPPDSLDQASIIAQILGCGASGGLLVAIVGVARNAMAK